MEAQITFLKGDKMGIETDYRDSLPVNMSGIVRPMFGAQGYMLMQPGLTEYGNGIGIDRGGLWNERFQEHYRVSANSLIQVNQNGNAIELGTISGLDTVSMPYSFNTQAVIADGNYYLYSPSGGFSQVTDPELGNPIDCVWIDGYYFFTDGEFLYHTNLNDETAIDPLKFATAEFSPDPTIGVGKTTDNKAIAFGRYSTEYFINQSNPNFAFTRAGGRAIKSGIVGTHCKAEMGDIWYVMGGRKEEAVSINALGVGSYTKVSSREVDKIIGQYSEAELAPSILEARVEDSYSYLIVHLPNETLLFNETLAKVVGNEQAWSILKSDVEGDLPWRGIHGLFEPRRGDWVYGDKRSNKLALLDESVATHSDEIVEWVLNTPYLFLERLSLDAIEIETLPGFTGTSDATVFLSLTYNGVTHGTEVTLLYGLPSQYEKRFVKRRLGYIRDWVSIKLRGANRSRMAFGRAMIEYG